MYMDDEELLQKIAYERNLSEGTWRNYRLVMMNYSNFLGKSFTQLIQEAQNEERKRIPWIDRQLKNDLLNYRVWLYRNYNESSAAKYFSILLTIYRHHYIEIHYLPPISNKNTKKSEPLTYRDLPTKEIIQNSLHMPNCKGVMIPLIFVFSSSGASLIDVLKLKFIDYIKALDKYINSSVEMDKLESLDPYKVISIVQEIQEEDNLIIPVFYNNRKKTAQPHFVFWSPEAVAETNKYLLSRENLKWNDQLFKIHPRYLSQKFLKINNELGLGSKNGVVKFSSKMLRKFHATALERSMGKDKVDFLQGRKSITTTQQSYYFNNPEDLMEDYVANLDKLMINYECEIIELDNPEVQKIKQENVELRAEREELIERSKEENKEMVLSILKKYGIEVDK